jgi:hypothetical protein
MATTETSPKPRKKPAAKASAAPSAAKTKSKAAPKVPPKADPRPDSRAQAAESATQAGAGRSAADFQRPARLRGLPVARPAPDAGDAVGQPGPRRRHRPGRDRRGRPAPGRPPRRPQSRSLPRRPSLQRGDDQPGRPARPAAAGPGRPVQPLHGPVAVGGPQDDRRADPARGRPRPGRQAVQRPRLGVQPDVRHDEAELPAVVELAERPGLAGRRRRPERQAPGRVLHQDADRRLLAVELPDLQPRRPARGDAEQGREPGARHGELRRRPGARRRPAGDQPDRPGQVQGRRERRHRPGQGGLPERHPAAAAVRPDHRDGARDPAADLPAVDQQVLHPGPAAPRTR